MGTAMSLQDRKDMSVTQPGLPPKQGLYDPRFEHDACGIGFVVNIKGKKSHQIVDQALTALQNLDHRGARGCEEETGDGAGILLQVPHAFLQRACAEIGVQLPEPGQYGVGMIFLPPDPAQRQLCVQRLETLVREEGQAVLGWRDVPTNDSDLGDTAKSCKPCIRQIFIGRNASLQDDLAFERKLYVIRRRAENALRYGDIAGGAYFYVPSLSYKTIIYKGMLTPCQVATFYPDLSDPLVETAIAVFHSRFSTNTFPSWARSHPYRYLIHNGEINTLRGNENWMHARQAMLASTLFGDDLPKRFPIIQDDGSDSAKFDNCLEFLTLSGRSLPQAMMMMIPEPWENHESMSDEKRAFYQYHSSLMEPWDGPASIAFTDGIQIGAVLDRNGLRPSRYYVTKDDLVVMSSEVGVLDIPPDRVLRKGRLQPGRIFLVDTAEQRIVSDEELKERISRQAPYGEWLRTSMLRMEDLPAPVRAIHPDHEVLLRRQEVFGYTSEDVKLLMSPMADTANEAIGSMGTDTPLAVLSERPQLLFNYFKQLFAQVTNPPVDAIREALVMSTDTTVGPEANMLEPTAECARQIKLSSPILTNKELEKLKYLGDAGFSGFRSITLPMLFPADDGRRGLEDALDTLCRQSSKAISERYGIILLSDRGVTPDHAPIPALLAVSAIHHHLIREGTRTQVGFVIESGEPREVHHFALLLGYGAAAINPYLAFETLSDMIRRGLLNGVDADRAVRNYIEAINKGVVKVISKMGISTFQSYCGAQVFEALGLDQDFVDRYFTWTPSRIGGIGLDVIAEEARMRHRRAFPDRSGHGRTLDGGGQYSYRREGEYHLFNPETIHKLQHACRVNSYEVFKQYSKLVDDQAQRLCTLRGLMELRSERKPIS